MSITYIIKRRYTGKFLHGNPPTQFLQANNLAEAQHEAEQSTPPGQDVVSITISEAQRLLDPELDHTKMRVEDGIFLVDWGEVCDLANDKDLPADLSADEMRVFLKCIESGLSCWREVVELALRAATSERSKT